MNTGNFSKLRLSQKLLKNENSCSIFTTLTTISKPGSSLESVGGICSTNYVLYTVFNADVFKEIPPKLTNAN
jgi:hypothetical protein